MLHPARRLLGHPTQSPSFPPAFARSYGAGSRRLRNPASSRPARAPAGFLTLGLALRLVYPQRAQGEGYLDLKREWYDEDHHRIHVDTSAAEAQASITKSTLARVKVIYDSISGASPNGMPPPPGSNQVPLKEMSDHRKAVDVQLSQQWGGHTLTPSFGYSLENDYESYGVGYTHSIEFNQKNTVLSLGAAGTFDRVFPKFWYGQSKQKKSGDFLIGLSQLLDPNTILTANISVGLAHGYLSDPYKAVHFTFYPDPNYPFPEVRPKERIKEVGFFSLRHYFAPLQGSAELEYRIYHDSYEVLSHTAGLTWYQNVGRHLILSPMVRYTRQSAAYFYVTELPGDPSCPMSDPLCPQIAIPAAYSADYRLSSMHTWTLGLKASVQLTEHIGFDVAYKRYAMHGDDHITSASAYPSANIVTGGITIWF